ncbi:MAG: helix-turn-helix domain-containing protein [Acidobacteriota bacterium]
MDLNADSLRYILALKLRRLRQARGLGLKETAQAAGLSISYLSEIEKARKYPKPDKILQLAQAFGVPYDELVSPKMDDELGPVGELFASPLLREFPFQLFGLEPESVVQLVSEAPSRAGALLRTFLELGRTYDLRVEDFLFAALRSYQQMHGNHFPEIEKAATSFLEARSWERRLHLPEEDLRRVLEEEHGYTVGTLPLERHPELADLRSVWLHEGGQPHVLINPRLRPAQRAFALGRELGYLELGLEERSTTSVQLRVESFDQLVNDFQAAYFSGALLLHRELLVEDLGHFFARPRWSRDALLDLLGRYRTTPETFFYRLSQLLPHEFGMERLFFLRFSHRAGSEEYRLSKILNMTQLPIPLSVEPNEHYCRRWLSLRLLGEMPARRAGARDERVGAQRSAFDSAGEEFLILTLVRPLSLIDGVNSSISLGIGLDDAARRRIAFVDDASIAGRSVDLTCERCPLADCGERVADPIVRLARERDERREAGVAALREELLGDAGAPPVTATPASARPA